MTIAKEKIKELTKEFGEVDNNTGSTETQIAIITEPIRNI
jgi:ribosomal protein S15P/S13E